MEGHEDSAVGRSSEVDQVDLPSSLICILDLNPQAWAATASKGGPGPQEAAETLLTFLRAFLLLNGGNSVTIIGCHSSGAEILYQSQAVGLGGQAARQRRADRKVGALEMDYIDNEVHAAIVDLANRVSDAQTEDSEGGASTLSAAFAMAACIANRLVSDKLHRSLPRVLAMVASSELPSQYIPIMNSVFSFQKIMVMVDSLVISDQDCGLLQQACDITHGVYLRPELDTIGQTGDGALLQWMLSVYLSDKFTRLRDAEKGWSEPLLRLPKSTHVDYRSSCFKTARPLDVGFVCSVCLSIFAEAVFVCPTCESKIAMARGPTAAKKRKATAPAKK